MTLPPGSRLGPYQIVALLGRGGMGLVYRARDPRLQRDVAIKILPPGWLVDEAARRRFQREALALARLSHPNIATVYDVGEQDQVSYIVMECVPGESLAARIRTGALPLEETLTIATQIGAALQEAHDHGIIHRDLKPANVMVTPQGRVKVLDFGLARLVAPAGDDSRTRSLTESRVRAGTVLYMSPEQAFGETIDHRTDLWSFGILLYEALAGRTPFEAPGELAVLRAVSQDRPRPVSALRPGVPPEIERTIGRALEKDPTRRYQSAAEMSRDLAAALGRITAAPPALPLKRAAFLAFPVLLLLALGAGFFLRNERRHWAREEALPEVARLEAQDHPLAAFRLLTRAAGYLPADTTIRRATASDTRVVTITSTPPGATVEIQDYLAPKSGWYRLGVTPLAGVVIPRGYLRWRLSRPGTTPYLAAPMTSDTMAFALDSARRTPPGMVRVPGGEFGDFIDFLGWIGPYRLPTYYLDRLEVTNREYQAFVDQGGYRQPRYWPRDIVRDGRRLSWEQAMALFRDRTGRAGPATWEAGHYPTGQEDYPVSGISWFEASAYASFAGKSLPTLGQWYHAAPPEVATFTVRASNISRDSLAPAGAFPGLGPTGTYDMAGNVREWVANTLGADRRFILGGTWKSETYLFSEPEALSPFDRSPGNGVRCVRNVEPLPAEVLRPIRTLERDFSRARPVSDAVFQAYRLMYAYDRTALNPRAEGVVADTTDWREEKISFDAAYDHQRLAAYLFLPKKVRPPYQTIVFFPSARVLDLSNSSALGDVTFFDYVVQSGRAVLYPIYQDTYERRLRTVLPGASQDMELTVQRYQDLARSLDYLETRPDIDTTRLAYLGVSMGAADGVIYATLEQRRLRTVVLLDGGFFLGKPLPGRDQVDFAPRLRKPVLMVNGRYDFSFSLEKSQLPLFHMLGTPPADKAHVVLESPHDVRAQRPAMVQAVLGWLDRYLGRVQ